MDNKKEKGVYYTPPELASFIVNYIMSEYDFNQKMSIMEPSCGDGIFIDGLSELKEFNKAHIIDLSLVEIDNNELIKLKNKKYEDKIKGKIDYFSEDYLYFQENNQRKFDVILGNPPYINRKLMSLDQITISNKILNDANISNSNIKNIWTAFLVSSAQALNEDGVVCFVLPSEILQVKHAESIRKYLITAFNCIEIFTFNEIIFKDIEQDTIVLIASKQKNKRGFHYHNFNSLEDVGASNFTTITNSEFTDSEGKWTSLFLSKRHNELLTSLKQEIPLVNDYCTSCAGIVTAANDEFIVDNKTIEKFKLHQYAHKIIKKSSYIKNLIIFRLEDLTPLIEKDTPTNLLLFDDNEKDFHAEARGYLKILTDKKIHERYKCKKRGTWFVIPSVWNSEGFFFKRSYQHAKVIINHADVSVTDTAYRISMKEGYDINSFTFSFYNSLTLVYTELYGRYYGGGVLELTPNEFKKLPLPYVKVSMERALELDQMFRNEINFEGILEFTNRVVLIEGFGFTEEDVELLNTTRLLLMRRRMKM
ncbi:type I restriction endonuclease subunit M [Paenibacillus sp. 1011MAR3C5]|uniref:Eco57I restriction-modification methylase domain-containing protein n=1 Tax=Paenibacillus sp. 1011MAR3C5 TaxID=1675787 RepID=UPI000E6BB943|nr:N-6 DNA methylase [Paenibacillus sp. 1011MAR3C5]RJE88709.1 type I restriction endonuclease subunit M [Paenibacillus sp. 1011MAR3C5]